MAGDITRSTFDPKKGYTSVRMQQGRLQLDADWNEQADIQNHLRRAYVTDMIGSGSGASKVDPITGEPSTTNFQLCRISTGETSQFTDLALLPGHFYINGVLCESAPGTPFEAKATATNTLEVIGSLTIDSQRLREGDWLIQKVTAPTSAQDTEVDLVGWRIQKIDVKTRTLTVIEPSFKSGDTYTLQRVITYSTQTDLPEAPSLEASSLKVSKYFAYLDVWEQHLSAIDDPTLREVALNVPDTTTRTKIVWQVKLRPVKEEPTKSAQTDGGTPQATNPTNLLPAYISQQWDEFQNQNQFREEYRDLAPLLNACARLCAGTSTNGITANRLGNFLYRVEVHQGNDSDADPFGKRSTVTFKWSRTNGSVVSPIKKLEGDVIRIAKASQDVWADSQPGQWLELLTLAQELKGEPGILVPLVRVSDTKIEFDPARIIGGAIPDDVTKVRRWDHSVDKAPQGAIPIQSEWIELESGIKVQFYPNRTYRTGDYWLIPSRTATNDIEWPSDRADEDVTLADNQGASVSQPLPQPPNGIEHQYALLAIVEVADGKDKDQKQITQVTDQRVLFPPLQRTLDTAGGTITGNLIIKKELPEQGNLTVEGTTTTHDLRVLGNFASNIFKAETFEIIKDPINNPIPFGAIRVGESGATKQIEFQAEPGTNFVFLNGNVGIRKLSSDLALDVEGILNATNVLQNGLQLTLRSETENLENQLISVSGQVDGLRADVSGISGQVDGLRADVSGISGQVDGLRADVSGISGQVDGLRADVSGISGQVNGLRTDVNGISGQVTALADNTLPLTGGNIIGSLSVPTLSVGLDSIPSLIPPAQLYVKGNLYIDDNDDSNGGKIFAKAVATIQINSEDIATTSVKSQNFTQLSSGALKEQITELSRQEVAEALGKLNPVRFVFRDDAAHVPRAGFIAEDVPDLLATPDHRSIKIMDLVAILTKAVQDNRKVINQLSKQVTQQAEEINQLKQVIHNARSPSP